MYGFRGRFAQRISPFPLAGEIRSVELYLGKLPILTAHGFHFQQPIDSRAISIAILESPPVSDNKTLTKPNIRHLDHDTFLAEMPSVLEPIPLLSLALAEVGGATFPNKERKQDRAHVDIETRGQRQRPAMERGPKDITPPTDPSDEGDSLWLRLYFLLMPPLKQVLIKALLLPEPLYPFQYDGVHFLFQNHSALLADEMGLGKTVQAIVALRLLLQRGLISEALVVCPASLKANWFRELNKWASDLDTVVVEGSSSTRWRMWFGYRAHVRIASYEQVRNDISDLEPQYFDLIILDEAQRIKNSETELSKAVKALSRGYSWCLTGTPLENRIEELVSVLDFVKPGLLRENMLPGIMHERMAPHFRRRRKEEVLTQLPPKRYEDSWVELTVAQRAAYKRAEEEGLFHLRELGEDITVQHIFALLTRLKQICNFDPETGESAKLDQMYDYLDEVVENERKALVFSQYAETLKWLEGKLTRFSPLIYHGSLSQPQRDSAVRTFQQDPNRRVLLISLLAGGLGLNLQAASYVYHYDSWWNPARMSQAEDRAHRIGQQESVLVTRFLCVNTIEERIEQILKRKRRLFNEYVEGAPQAETLGLSEQELFEVIGLDPGMARRRPPREGDAPDPPISPREFEHLVGRLYKAMGYKVTVTQASRDGGVDVIASQYTLWGQESVAVQCKRYEGTVGREDVQKLWGVVNADPSITQGVLVTTGKFSREARQFAEGKRLRLIDGGELEALRAQFEAR